MSTSIVILLDQDPDRTYKVALGERNYDVRIKYLQRITNETTTPILADQFTLEIGVSGADPFLIAPLKTNRNVLEQVRHRAECPEGTLMLRDNTADDSIINGGVYRPERVGYDTIGERFSLQYYDPSIPIR